MEYSGKCPNTKMPPSNLSQRFVNCHSTHDRLCSCSSLRKRASRPFGPNCADWLSIHSVGSRTTGRMARKSSVPRWTAERGSWRSRVGAHFLTACCHSPCLPAIPSKPTSGNCTLSANSRIKRPSCRSSPTKLHRRFRAGRAWVTVSHLPRARKFHG